MSANLVLPWATSSYPAGRELEQQEFRVRQVDRWSTLTTTLHQASEKSQLQLCLLLLALLSSISLLIPWFWHVLCLHRQIICLLCLELSVKRHLGGR